MDFCRGVLGELRRHRVAIRAPRHERTGFEFLMRASKTVTATVTETVTADGQITLVVGDTRVVVPAPTHPAGVLAGRLGFWAQIAFLVAYIGVLSGAMFYFQFALGELPCPLCILQRMGMMLSSLGPLYIVIRSLRGTLAPADFMTGLGFAIVGALLGAAMSIRQILLHIMPGDPGYGTAILGLHLYTWALVSFIVVLSFAGVLLTFGTEFLPIAPVSTAARTVAWVVIWIFVATIVANLIAVFFLEGFNFFLPDNPTEYMLTGWKPGVN
jgi:disulfide bond formation protein DsbB